MDEAFWAMLTGSSAVQEIVAAGVFWGVAPQDAVPSYLVVTVISATDNPHMQGAGGFWQYRVQVDSYGTDRPAARALSRAVLGALNGKRAGEIRLILIDAEREIYEDGAAGRPFRFSQDFIVTWRPDHG
ncbi:tail completion protein gp17 [Paenirhodobacter populi]|uniref:DUF3168 domain-containing protein n=1 Tax=Paenirhodobacter populi TaxID=2306993 RepID=A0A443JEB1_9RHOB|nr:DUF3168 domain-containing protein [Sinirhodobacter populi]RWR18801.1 DUF3168 domain-containing protein [Sinirhodobacter populi]